jgi:hypothetical protein
MDCIWYRRRLGGGKNMEGIKRRREFEEALRNVVAKLDREGKDRLERTHIEEIGKRYGLGPNEARKLFAESRGNVWKGELVDGDEEPGWEAVRLESAPSTHKDDIGI